MQRVHRWVLQKTMLYLSVDGGALHGLYNKGYIMRTLFHKYIPPNATQVVSMSPTAALVAIGQRSTHGQRSTLEFWDPMDGCMVVSTVLDGQLMALTWITDDLGAYCYVHACVCVCVMHTMKHKLTKQT